MEITIFETEIKKKKKKGKTKNTEGTRGGEIIDHVVALLFHTERVGGYRIKNDWNKFPSKYLQFALGANKVWNLSPLIIPALDTVRIYFYRGGKQRRSEDQILVGYNSRKNV